MPKKNKWSKKVTETSDAMTLDKGVFKKSPTRLLCLSSARLERSRRRKSTPFRSAMSMLTFYENRGGKNLSLAQRKSLKGPKTNCALSIVNSVSGRSPASSLLRNQRCRQ